MSKLRRSLSSKLSLRILLMAIPIFILCVGTLFIQSLYLIRLEAAESANSTLRRTVMNVRAYMGSVETSTEANAWLLEEHFNPDSLRSISHRMVHQNRHILSCSVSAEPNTFPQYGRHFSLYTVNDGDSITTMLEPPFDYFSKQWYQEPVNTGHSAWEEPFDDNSASAIDHHAAVATYCRPLRVNGRVVGVVSSDISFAQLARSVINTEHPYPGAYFVLLGSDGRYFIHPDTTRLFRKTIFTDADPRQHSELITLGHEMTSGRSGSLYMKVHDSDCYVCYQPVPGTNWSLAMVSPVSGMQQGYHRQMFFIGLIIIIGLILIMWLTRRVVGYIIEPFHYLMGASRRIAEGQLDERIPMSDSRNPVGQLQVSLSRMQNGLYIRMNDVTNRIQEAERINRELENNMDQEDQILKRENMFIHKVAQQMRSPLNVILGFTGLLEDSYKAIQAEQSEQDALMSQDEMNTITSMMKSNAIKLNRMVLMLYDSSEMGGDRKYERTDEVSCNALVQECIAYAKTHFPDKHAEMETTVPDTLHILTNHLYLMRSVRDLLYNACKFSDGQHIKVRIKETEHTVQFIVEDKGPGIKDKSTTALFHPFTKIDDLMNGLGLGLPLCKRHANSLGGDLTLDTDYLEGARFVLEVPK